VLECSIEILLLVVEVQCGLRVESCRGEGEEEREEEDVGG